MHNMLNVIQFLRNHMFQMNFKLNWNEKAEYVEEEKMGNEMKICIHWKWKNVDNENEKI